MIDEPILPTILVIFGATGDLVAKKIVPALFHLHEKGRLPKIFRVVGFARRDLADVFRAQIADIVRAHAGSDLDEDTLETFLGLFAYHRGNFDEAAGYEELATRLGQIDGEWKTCANKLFYLAVPPESYKTIFAQLAASGLTEPCGGDEGWTRVIVEKPIGRDAKSAEELEEQMADYFKEEQIYRIDHYLAKEMVQNILTFRFSNSLFEHAWDNSFIEKITIRLNEAVGVEKRGAFYDTLGTLRDVGQNHLLQMLAFATMDMPERFDAAAIRQKRAKILQTLTPWTEKKIQAQTHRAQYDGYRNIDGVKPDSMVETYFRVETSLNHPRWKGVPITIESGKRMGKVQKDMVVEFKHPTPCLCPEGHEHMKNGVTFMLEPEEKISIQFWAKKPGLTFDVEERSLDLTLREKSTRTQYVEEYEKLLLDCIVGDQTLFISTDEVKAMWKFTDPIVETWAEGKVALGTYKPDTDEASETA